MRHLCLLELSGGQQERAEIPDTDRGERVDGNGFALPRDRLGVPAFRCGAPRGAAYDENVVGLHRRGLAKLHDRRLTVPDQPVVVR